MKITVTFFTQHTGETRRGRLNIRLDPLELEISNIILHEADGHRWIVLPENVSFRDPKTWNWFQAAVLEDLDRWLSNWGETATGK